MDRTQLHIVEKELTKAKADNTLRQIGVAVDGHIIENGRFRPERAPPYVPSLKLRRKASR